MVFVYDRGRECIKKDAVRAGRDIGAGYKTLKVSSMVEGETREVARVHFFENIEDLFMTGSTKTNVMDISLVLAL